MRGFKIGRGYVQNKTRKIFAKYFLLEYFCFNVTTAGEAEQPLR